MPTIQRGWQERRVYLYLYLISEVIKVSKFHCVHITNRSLLLPDYQNGLVFVFELVFELLFHLGGDSPARLKVSRLDCVQ